MPVAVPRNFRRDGLLDLFFMTGIYIESSFRRREKVGIKRWRARMRGTLYDSPVNSMKKQSIWAVVAGILFVIVVTTLVDIFLHAVGIFPPLEVPIDDRLSLIATSYRVVIGIAAGYVTAKHAPANPMKHAMILGSIGTVLGTLGVVASWGSKLGPSWYPIALAVLAIPQSWIGGRFYQMRKPG
jgi:hypothetical protein